ncbi:MAG TPA: TonB-dependent receptor plug domain-containing protein, partial [Chitinophagaceae bacterium]
MRNFADCLLKTKQLLSLALFLLLSTVAFSQTRVSGKVTGPDGKPVFGATVSVKGTNVATTTTADGSYAVAMPARSETLVFSFVGFEVSEVNVRGANVLDVAMKLQSTSLNEVVVTGYSAQRKKDITGSVAVVNVNNMKAIPSGTTESLLQGQASGVSVINSGSPGGGSNLRIRGINSFGNSDPLVIIDGVQGNLHDLNVNDIESIQVLKDAGATAIYGIQGANGVIVVTTKKGRAGRAKVSYDMYMGTQRPLKNGFNLANTAQYADVLWRMAINSGAPFSPTNPSKQFGTGATPVIPDYITPHGAFNGDPGTDPSTYDINSNQITKANKQGTDWFHELFKPAMIQNHNLQVSGGGDRSSYLFSFNYFDQQGTLINTFLKRYSV